MREEENLAMGRAVKPFLVIGTSTLSTALSEISPFFTLHSTILALFIMALRFSVGNHCLLHALSLLLTWKSFVDKIHDYFINLSATLLPW